MKIIEGKFWEVECACGNRSERYFNTQYLRLNLIKYGWVLENDVAICPACFAAQQSAHLTRGRQAVSPIGGKDGYRIN